MTGGRLKNQVMPDYGHPLEFGSFITPSNTPTEQAVALAQLSERLGYELVTFQDHPYQPQFYDTWTLLSWVAAKTDRIRVSGNVLNLPLRPPAVLARAVASLDLLSGGRVELGLGAGGFWDAIEAMGGRRLTAGQSVTALSEAIEVIRGIWAADSRGGLRFDGEFYQTAGAKRGPRPAHQVPINVGAYKPRMLRLVARQADGWLPSLPYLQPGDLARGNALIDETAVGAGRDPREIRRMLNIGGSLQRQPGGLLQGPPEQWIAELTELALTGGIGTFLVMGDDPATLEAIADQIAPAVREAVASERRTAGTDDSPVRPAIALRQRREGIDYDAIPPNLRVAAIEPGDFDFPLVRSTYMRGGNPGLVLRVHSADEVAEALAYARTQAVPLSIRSGGHGISGRSTNDGGIVIDLGAMNQIRVLDEQARRVRLEPGARWMDVAAALETHGWALTSGDYGGVGVGGLATAGGLGFLAREHGLTIDHLVAAEVVLADGTFVRADADQNQDLFWAVRGAGANVGVVTAMEFVVDEVHEVGWAQLAFGVDDAAEFMTKWGAWIESAPRDVTSFLVMGGRRPGEPLVAQTMTMVDASDPEVILERLQPMAQFAPLVGQSIQVTTYAQVMANASGTPHDGQGEPNARSVLLERMTPEFAQAAASLIESGATYFFQIRAAGGAVGDVPADATAYAHREAQHSVVAFGASRSRIDAAWEAIRPLGVGIYLSFETDLSAALVQEAFPPATLERLRGIKRRYDPQHVLRDNFDVLYGED